MQKFAHGSETHSVAPHSGGLRRLLLSQAQRITGNGFIGFRARPMAVAVHIVLRNDLHARPALGYSGISTEFLMAHTGDPNPPRWSAEESFLELLTDTLDSMDRASRGTSYNDSSVRLRRSNLPSRKVWICGSRRWRGSGNFPRASANESRFRRPWWTCSRPRANCACRF